MIWDCLQAEVNVQKATNNANRSTRQMEETINDFQRQKLEDVKVGKIASLSVMAVHIMSAVLMVY